MDNSGIYLLGCCTLRTPSETHITLECVVIDPYLSGDGHICIGSRFPQELERIAKVPDINILSNEDKEQQLKWQDASSFNARIP